MINLETFKKIMKDIELQEEKDDKLTKLLVNDSCYGWISTANVLIDNLLLLLKENLNDEYDYISWWLYDTSEQQRHVYESIDEKTECVMDLNNIEDLYYYIIGEHEKVKQFTQPKEKKETFTKNNSVEEAFDIIFGAYEGKKPDISNIQLT